MIPSNLNRPARHPPVKTCPSVYPDCCRNPSTTTIESAMQPQQPPPLPPVTKPIRCWPMQQRRPNINSPPNLPMPESRSPQPVPYTRIISIISSIIRCTLRPECCGCHPRGRHLVGRCRRCIRQRWPIRL